MAVPYFHVFIQTDNDGPYSPLLLDLSEQDLRLRVVNPYKDRKDIYDKGKITRISDIRKIAIYRSDLPAKATLEKLASDHQAELERILHEEGRRVLGSYRGRNPIELAECCTEVTSDWIIDSPGTGSEWTVVSRFFHNPWVVRVGAGGILYLLGFFTHKYFGG